MKKKKPKLEDTAPIPFPLREQLRRRNIAVRIGIPSMPEGESDNRRAAVPPRGGVVTP